MRWIVPAMNQTKRLYPSRLPDGETAVDESPAFVAAYKSLASDHAAAIGWRLGKSVLTQSNVWGLVWRIDFRTNGQPQDSKLVNRFICWGKPDGEILGTALVFDWTPL